MFWKKTAPVQTPARPAMSALAMALEPRMMFDGAVAATAAEVADAQATAQAADAQPTADASSSHDNLAATPTGTADHRQEIVFVDGQVQDYQQLLAGMKQGTEVVVLDPKGDGLKQISDYLAGRTGIDAIHIVSHGLPGQVTLGSLTLDKAGLDARAADLGKIGQSLDTDGDILFYGCDVGSGVAGQAFVNQVAQLTGADIAASNDSTGAASRGGDWALEVTSGSIEAVTPFSAAAQEAFSGRLFAGTLNFNGSNAALGTTVTDGQANSTDIPGVVIEIYSANSGNTNSNSQWEYYSDLFGNGTPNAEGIVDSSGDGTPIVIIRSQNGADFSFTGIKVVDYLGAHAQVTFEAFRDGVLLGSVTLTTDGGDFISDFNQSNGLTASIFQNVDEIRISDPSSGDGNLYVGLDNIGFADVPRPSLVSATFADNNLKIGETSTVTFTFNMAVTGFTTADLTVPNGSISGLASSDGGTTWTGLFTPNASVTDSTNVITVDLTGVNAVSGGLAGTGTANSSNYAIDTAAPSVSSVTSSTANGTYKAGDVISIQVNFSENVTVSGTPQLTLETGSTDRVVNYASGSGTSTLTFTYTVQAGDTTADLDYIGTTALALNGGSIRDAATNDATLTLASPGTAGSLGANKAIVVNSAAGIANLDGDSVGWAGEGSAVVLDAGGNAALSDTEFGALNGGNGNWAGGSLTVQRPGTASAADVFGFSLAGAAFTVSGNALQSGGQTFATFTNTGGVLTITFTSSGTPATTALVNDVVQHISYRNDTPSGDTTLQFSLNDGTSTTTANMVVTSDFIYVTNSNDTATINLSNGVSFSEAVAIAAADSTGSQTIVFASSLAGQTLNLNTVSINESLTFDMDQASGLVLTGGTITLGGGTTQTFTHGAGDTAAINSIVAGSGALTKAGAGNLTLAGAGNTYTGATTISAGTLTVSGGDALATVTNVSVAAGATLALASSETIGNLSGAGSVTLGSFILTSTQTADTTFSGAISGTGGVTFTQSGSATYSTTLSGTNTYTGVTLLANYGWLKLSGDASMADNSVVRVNGNSVLTLLSNQTIGSLASNNVSASIQLGNYTLTAGGDNTSTTVAGVISGTGSLVKQGSGILNLSGSNTYGGTTTVAAGALSIAGDGNLGSGAVNLADGTVLNVSGASTIDNAITLTGNSTLDNGNAVTLSGAISGAYDLTKTGSGTLTLSGSNSYGATYVNAGTLSVSSDGNLGSGAVNLAAGTTLALTGATTVDNAIVLGGDAAVSAAANATLSGVISGAFTLTKAGASTLTLSGTNTYGATTVSAGTLSVASDSNLGSGTVTLAGGSTLAVTGATTIDNAIALGGSATVNTGAATTLSGVISGSSLTKSGASTLTLAGSNTFTGSTTVNAGTLSIASDANLGAGALNLANGTTLQITGNTTIDNALALTGLVTVNAGAAATLSGTIGGTGSLTKTGASNLTLSGSNINSGTTTVAAGTLVVDGSTASATTVASGATLAGSGTLGGDVIVQSGGTLSPGGAGVATLTVNGNLTLASGSTLALDINGATAGTGYDRVVVNGTVDVSGAALAVTHGYAAGSGDSYTVIVNDAADAVTGTFSGVSEGGKFNAAGNGTELTTSYIGGSGNDLSLTAPIAPTVTSVSSSTANGTYKIGDVITVTVQFDGAVNVTGTPTLTLETGATDRVLNYVSGSGTDTLSFSYTVQAGDSSADLDYASTSALSLNGGTIKDGANQNAILTLAAPGAAGSLGANKALVVDGVRPTATSINLSDTALRIGETATVTITFAERVVGLDTADFTVSGGSLSGLISSDGGLTWTATFTPSANVSDATNIITLNNAGVMDLAGNVGSGTTDSGNYAIDTQRPTATVVVTDTALKAGQTTTVTITFNEAVSGLTTADFSVANGTLSGLSSSDGGITWTATLTPSASVTDTSNLVTLDNTGLQDLAGNAGTGTTDSNNYAIDTQRPTATIVVTDTALKAGQGTTVTITFSEAVSGLTTADFSVANGSLSGLSSADGGITWTATLTPSANVTDPTNLITLDNTGYTDAAGNTGTGTTDSNNYAIDSRAPAVTSVGVPANGTYLTGNTLDFTVNFDEAVIVDTTGGTPRLAITLDTGGTVYADYVSGSGGVALVFRLTVASGQADANGISVGGAIDAHGGTLRDAAGNDVTTTLNSVGDTSAVLVDAVPPRVTNIALDGTSPTTNSSVSFTVTFSEDVTGVDLSDFALLTGGSASGTLQSLVQLSGNTYRITVSGVTGQGSLGLSLQAAGAGITDVPGSAMVDSYSTIGYQIGSLDNGDPEFRANPPVTTPIDTPAPLQPTVPSAPPPSTTTSPLLPPPLFEQPTLGSGIPTVGNIFINNGALAPSFIAQVFASSDSGGDGGGAGFLGFGGGDGGVFGASTFSGLFSKDKPQESNEKIFDKQRGNGQGGRSFGAPTLGQQLHEMKEAEQRQVRQLAQALGQVAGAAAQG
nr:Ig-like domain-containing protein [Pseudomonas tohonis]